jgi:hypothetical protein
MKAVVERAVRRAPVPASIEQVDISGNPDLEARYGLEIPVLLIDGRKVAKYRVSETQLQRMLVNQPGVER